MKKKTYVDYLIVGGGPAGLQLGYFMQSQNENYLIVEAASGPGSFFSKFPRHRKLISINKVFTGSDDPNLNMRWDWNSLICEDEELLFKKYTKEYFPPADRFVDYLQDFTTKNKLNIQFNTEVKEIRKVDDLFLLTDHNGGVFESRVLIMATGLSLPYTPQIKGIELCDNYVNMSLDKKEYENKKVLIIGKGNSAFETADHLIASTSLTHLCSPSPLQLAWKSHFVGHLRAINNNLLDTYHLKSQNAIIDAHILSIEKIDKGYRVYIQYNNELKEYDELLYDKVLVCAGFKWDGSVFHSSTQPELIINNRFPAQTSEWESTNIEDLYFAGTIMQVRDFKKYTSAFLHGFRYNIAVLDQILRFKYQHIAMPYQSISSDADTICETIFRRIRTGSSFWQQPGYLGDVVLFHNKENENARYYTGIPVDYVHDHLSKIASAYYIMTFEYGMGLDMGDHESSKRIGVTDYQQAENSKFIHPIIRFFEHGELVSTHHVIEDFELQWLKEHHVEPLRAYLKTQPVEQMQ